jgi:hypothetical protein
MLEQEFVKVRRQSELHANDSNRRIDEIKGQPESRR